MKWQETQRLEDEASLEEKASSTDPSSGADVERGEVPVKRNQDGDEDPFLVRFADDDVDDPKNFKPWFKSWMLLVMGSLAFAGSSGSSIIVPASEELSAYLNVSMEVTALLLSLYVLGFAFGPLLWGPISEVYGRKLSMLPAFFVFGLFSIGTATSHGAASVFVTRFFAGVFGSAPVSNVAAALGDIYEPRYRGIAMTFYSALVVGGPCIGPVMGAGVTADPHLRWRWTEYVQAIMVFFLGAIALLTVPESYGPVLLKRRAISTRKATGDDRYRHPHEGVKITLENVVNVHISRPLRMLTTEPMVTVICIYMSFVYALLFLMIEVYPIVFREMRGWGTVPASLPYLGIFVGVIVAILLNLANNPFYIRAVDANKGRPVPEARCPPMVVGGVALSAGLFWLGWTAAPQHPWVLPIIAGGFIGAGFNIVFQQGINFLVDTYGLYAASATSANTFLRSFMACGLPLAARSMFQNLGVGPAASLLGGLSCLALPIPFLFMRYGKRLRQKSKFVQIPDD